MARRGRLDRPNTVSNCRLDLNNNVHNLASLCLALMDQSRDEFGRNLEEDLGSRGRHVDADLGHDQNGPGRCDDRRTKDSRAFFSNVKSQKDHKSIKSEPG
jgi:hypothetical protein